MATMSATMKQFTKGLKTTFEPMQTSLSNIEHALTITASREQEIETQRAEKEKLEEEKNQTTWLKKLFGKKDEKGEGGGFFTRHWGKILTAIGSLLLFLPKDWVKNLFSLDWWKKQAPKIGGIILGGLAVKGAWDMVAGEFGGALMGAMMGTGLASGLAGVFKNGAPLLALAVALGNVALGGWAAYNSDQEGSGWSKLLGGALAGIGSGWLNSMAQAGTWGFLGFKLGKRFGPIAAVAGLIIGGAMGAIAGYFGAEKTIGWINEMDKEFKDFMKKFQNNFAVGPNMLKMGEKLEEEHAQKKKDLEFYKKWKKLSAVQGTHRQARELALKHGMGDPNNPKIGLLFGANLNKGAYFGNTDQEQLDSLQKEVKDIMKGEENARKFREQMNKPTVQKQSGLTTPDGTSITKIGYNPSVAGLSKSIGMMNWNFMKRMENLPGANKKHDPHTTGYVPGQGMGWGSKSGVTIATGFDLGWQTEKSISSLSSDLRSKLKPFLGKKGTTAYDLLMDSRMRGTGLTITKSQAQEIDQLQFAKYREELSAEATAKKFGFGSHWGDMTSAQKTVAASLRQLYGPKALAKKGYKTMQWLGQGREGSLKAIYELLNPKKWGSHMGRHKEEAKLLLREFLGPRVTPELLTEAMNLIQQENLLAKAPSSDDGFNLINAPTHNVNNSDNKMVVPFGAQDRNYPTLVPA